jgi:hypothetical protein
MKKTTIYLDEDDERLLAQAAARRGAARTDLIREAIRRQFGSEAGAHRRPRPLGSSGHADTSGRIDEILEEGFGR